MNRDKMRAQLEAMIVCTDDPMHECRFQSEEFAQWYEALCDERDAFAKVAVQAVESEMEQLRDTVRALKED